MPKNCWHACPTFDIPAHKVELEITEQSLSEHGANYVVRALNLLKQAGIQISLDDFGTGHSSLTRLQDYPVGCIKIDRNFVERMNSDPSALAIVKAITQIGSSIALDVLVEGIENTEQLDTLIHCDCQIGQGFYFIVRWPVLRPRLYSIRQINKRITQADLTHPAYDIIFNVVFMNIGFTQAAPCCRLACLNHAFS